MTDQEHVSRLKLLKTEFSLAFPAGRIQHKDFWDVITKNVDAYHEETDTLGKGSMSLKNGVTLNIDAILCGTGFYKSCSFLAD
jgi:hypothetical protein